LPSPIHLLRLFAGELASLTSLRDSHGPSVSIPLSGQPCTHHTDNRVSHTYFSCRASLDTSG